VNRESCSGGCGSGACGNCNLVVEGRIGKRQSASWEG
jgi:hypothetical protein